MMLHKRQVIYLFKKIYPEYSRTTSIFQGFTTQTGKMQEGSLEIEFDENGQDQLIVTGTVNLDGTLNLVPLGYLALGTYQFLNAGTINGSFATVNNYLSAVLETLTPSVDTFTITRNRL